MEDFIHTLPKHTSILMKDMPLYCYQGFWYPSKYIEGIILAQKNFKAEPTDIVFSSSAKTGTTWLKALAFATATRKIFDDSNNPLLTSVSHQCVPCVETQHAEILTNRSVLGSHPLISSHLPYSSLPESIITSDCKIVYIYRDPKDVIISSWHFLRELTKASEEEAPVEKACDEFCQGLTWYGSYWDHVTGYVEASLARPGRILILTYEDLKRDPFGNMKKLAEFMGYPFSKQEESEGVVGDVIKLCSFENLKSLEVSKSGHKKQRPGTYSVENRLFYRKAEVGDWKNYFTNEMKEKVDQLTEKKLNFGLVRN